jgi:calcium-dependent protein kinase
VKAGDFEFDPEEWDGISEEAKSIVRKLLVVDPENRLSAQQALNDPWIQKHSHKNAVNLKCM